MICVYCNQQAESCQPKTWAQWSGSWPCRILFSGFLWAGIWKAGPNAHKQHPTNIKNERCLGPMLIDLCTRWNYLGWHARSHVRCVVWITFVMYCGVIMDVMLVLCWCWKGGLDEHCQILRHIWCSLYGHLMCVFRGRGLHCWYGRTAAERDLDYVNA